MASTSNTMDAIDIIHRQDHDKYDAAIHSSSNTTETVSSPPPCSESLSVSSPASIASASAIPHRSLRNRTRSSSLSIKSGGDDDEEEGELSDVASTSGIGISSKDKKANAVNINENNGLKRSMKVVVQRTTDVEQRLPQMINKIGVIVETPRHPNTWFRVRFHDRKILTFRASALKTLGDAQADGDEIDLSEMPHDEDIGALSDDEEGYESNSNLPDDFVIDDKVVIDLLDATKRELMEFKAYDGKPGIIVENSPSGFKVRLDADEETILIKTHLLRRFYDEDATATDDEFTKKSDEKSLSTTHDEGSDGDNEEEEDEPSESTRRKSKKKDQGSFLSDLDTDLWIGRRVRINVGKYSGQAAIVLRSGNGWVQLKVEEGNENTAKRAYELTLLESMAEIERLAPTKVESNGSKDDESPENKDDDMDSGSQEERGSNLGSGGRRRGHYAQSWIERKVYLPGNQGTGIVKKADREVCTVELENANKTIKIFKKQELVLMDDDFSIQRHRRPNKGNSKLNIPDGVVLMGITTQRYAMFQDQVKKHVIRRRDKIKHRPNLMEWQASLNMQYRMPTDIEEDIVDLFVLPSCTLCGIEKESTDGACWNVKCPRCPVFNVDDTEEEISHYCRFPCAPLTDKLLSHKIQVPDVVVENQEPTPTEASRKRKRIENETLAVADEEIQDIPPVNEQEDEDFAAPPPPPPPTSPPQSVESPIQDDEVPTNKPTKFQPIVKVESLAPSPPRHPPPPSIATSPTVPVPTTTSAPSFRPQYESIFSKKN